MQQIYEKYIIYLADLLLNDWFSVGPRQHYVYYIKKLQPTKRQFIISNEKFAY